jgi:hypothetical protein
MRGFVLVVVSGSLLAVLIQNGCRTMPKGNHLAKLLRMAAYSSKNSFTKL